MLACHGQGKFTEINGRNMAWVESGMGDPIVLLHGNSNIVLSMAQHYTLS